MYKPFLLLLTVVIALAGTIRAQEMNPEQLETILTEATDTLQHSGNSMRMMYKDRLLICIYDVAANRMRIISPIAGREEVGEKELLNAMVANFHSALDVKYALSDEIIWSVFTHPLKELSPHQVKDAVYQVFSAAATFGSSYSSTSMMFPGNTQKKEKKIPERVLKKT